MQHILPTYLHFGVIPAIIADLCLITPRPHMLFPILDRTWGGGVATPHAISPLIEIELWDKDQTNP